ncbi:MAG: C40 family peptidase [Lachnospiraceae bacterium]|nr:C40 family peptidase [Lachnospiraceae bacterium]
MKNKKYKPFIVYLICLGMLLSALSVQAQETLPVVGPQIGTSESGTVAEPSETAAPVIELTPPETTTEEKPVVVEEPKTDGLSANEFLSLRGAQSDSVQAVGLRTECGSENSTADFEDGLLLARRMRRMAENSDNDLVIYRGNGFLNVREEPDATSGRIGKMYYNDTAYVKGREYTENGVWFRIESGNVNGYIKSEYVVSGYAATELISESITRFAYIKYDAQRVYRYDSTDSDSLGIVEGGQKYEVNWIKDDNFTLIVFAQENDSNVLYGYIPNSSYDLVWELPTAISVEEEERSITQMIAVREELASKDASREESRRVEESIRQSREESIAAYNAWLQQSIAASKAERERQEAAAAASRAQASREAESRAASIAERDRQSETVNWGNYVSMIPANTSQLRRNIVTNALQYVGKLPYVTGGTSLTTGADCSGFLLAIFAQYGIRLQHNSYSIARTGTKVVGGIAAARPGDIICYRTQNSRGHVTMFVGYNNAGTPMMVHARDVGWMITVSEVYYDGFHTVQNVIGD